MFPIHLAKTFLDFGVDPHKQCPINTVLTDTLVHTTTPPHICLDKHANARVADA